MSKYKNKESEIRAAAIFKGQYPEDLKGHDIEVCDVQNQEDSSNCMRSFRAELVKRLSDASYTLDSLLKPDANTRIVLEAELSDGLKKAARADMDKLTSLYIQAYHEKNDIDAYKKFRKFILEAGASNPVPAALINEENPSSILAVIEVLTVFVEASSEQYNKEWAAASQAVMEYRDRWAGAAHHLDGLFSYTGDPQTHHCSHCTHLNTYRRQEIWKAINGEKWWVLPSDLSEHDISTSCQVSPDLNSQCVQAIRTELTARTTMEKKVIDKSIKKLTIETFRADVDHLRKEQEKFVAQQAAAEQTKQTANAEIKTAHEALREMDEAQNSYDAARKQSDIITEDIKIADDWAAKRGFQDNAHLSGKITEDFDEL